MSEYIPEYVRIKSIEPTRNPDGSENRGLLIVTIETDDGEEYRFAIDFWQLCIEGRMADILRHWKYIVIPHTRRLRDMSDEEYWEFIEQFIGMEV